MKYTAAQAHRMPNTGSNSICQSRGDRGALPSKFDSCLTNILRIPILKQCVGITIRGVTLVFLGSSNIKSMISIVAYTRIPRKAAYLDLLRKAPNKFASPNKA
eukprot:1145526_1